MNPADVRLAYFSPTHTTERVLEAISRGTGATGIGRIDLTPPAAANGLYEVSGDELAIIGAPVYAGRVPPEAARRLRRLRGYLTPAVPVVVYGNRAYEDALLELCDLVTECGFVPVAAGAFIGEHSFSTEAVPLAYGRPDAADLQRAAAFGERVRAELETLDGLGQVPALQVPGSRPYREAGARQAAAPLTCETACTLCGSCAAVCPTGAVIVTGVVSTDAERCILCNACVKSCPSGARVLKVEWARKAMAWLSTHCAERKEPETYLIGKE